MIRSPPAGDLIILPIRSPAGGDLIGILWKCLMLVKLEWLGYRMVKKNYDDMLIRFHLIPERYGRTDRRTDMLYQYRVNMLTCDKNCLFATVLCTMVRAVLTGRSTYRALILLGLSLSSERLYVFGLHGTIYRVVQNKWHPWLIFSITLVKVHQF